MRYMLRVHVSLVELPEEPPAEEHTPGSDPMEGAMKSIGTMAARIFQPGAIAMPMAEPGGLDWRKAVAVSASNFSTATKILSEFEELTATIQLERV